MDECIHTELQEGQRYGRNKNTTINHSYINSGEYRNKFDKISDDKELNRKVYQIAKKMLEHRSGNLLVIHTHPNSMPPSINDFNSALKNKYQICLICCHDGKVFLYNSRNHVMEFFYKNTVAKYKKMGYNEYESQIHAITRFQEKGDISFREV